MNSGCLARGKPLYLNSTQSSRQKPLAYLLLPLPSAWIPLSTARPLSHASTVSRTTAVFSSQSVDLA